jgi:hypothetical protein
MTSTTSAPALWHRARFALLLAPALLAGCYVVPIVPRPVYGPGYQRPYPGPNHHHRHHRHWRGEATDGAAVAAATPSVHIEVSSNSR